MPLDLVIFDCDGVLVDSETIACRVELAILAELGHPISKERFLHDIVGTKSRDGLQILEAMWEKPLPADFETRVAQALAVALEAELTPIAGMADLLRDVTLAKCVASSSSPARIALSLARTGLLPLLDPYLYSSEMVENGKPAPDLFLYAARQHQARPASCLVIEDSVPGVRGAKAAGMQAIGFTAGGHSSADLPQRLKAAGADHLVATAPDLARLIAQLHAGRTA